VNRSANCNVDGRPCALRRKRRSPLPDVDPATGSVTKLAKTTVSRASRDRDAATGCLGDLRGEDRGKLGATRRSVVPDDDLVCRACSHAGIPTRAFLSDSCSPAYLFKQDGGRAVRPVITEAPTRFPIGALRCHRRGRPDRIASVVMLRSDHNTHSLTTGDRYVKLAFHQKGAADDGEIRVRAPKLPAQAVPGSTCFSSSTRLASRVWGNKCASSQRHTVTARLRARRARRRNRGSFSDKRQIGRRAPQLFSDERRTNDEGPRNDHGSKGLWSGCRGGDGRQTSRPRSICSGALLGAVPTPGAATALVNGDTPRNQDGVSPGCGSS